MFGDGAFEHYKMKRGFYPEGWVHKKAEHRAAARLERIKFITDVMRLTWQGKAAPSYEQQVLLWAEHFHHYLVWQGKAVLREYGVDKPDAFQVDTCGRKVELWVDEDMPWQIQSKLVWHLGLAAKFQRRKLVLADAKTQETVNPLDTTVFIPTP